MKPTMALLEHRARTFFARSAAKVFSHVFAAARARSLPELPLVPLQLVKA
eukprot:CAMPEP_0175283290 /NCGR_PEP_ID=MMETSP0093-20121207/52073_1 /TAXON_ID=311494 /ORGANISM="Alexandrium monilatum, Strain CCMP3105" /LENGTH=49 /DNA_ID= /DNA_START= /DNA_END= /DNA_ORIENTATION=